MTNRFVASTFLTISSAFLISTFANANTSCDYVNETSNHNLDFSFIETFDADQHNPDPEFLAYGEKQYLDCEAIPNLKFDPEAIYFSSRQVPAIPDPGETVFNDRRILIGKGGQIISIATPEVTQGNIYNDGTPPGYYIPTCSGLNCDFIAPQRWHAWWVDEVFQTVAGNGTARQSSSSTNNSSGNRYHYHQGGTYTRGIRGIENYLNDTQSGNPVSFADCENYDPVLCAGPYFSPILYNKVIKNGSEIVGYETLNLIQMAHIDAIGPTCTKVSLVNDCTTAESWRPDRYLVFMRIENVGMDIYRLNYAWFNHSKSNDPSLQSLENFNLPWFPANRETLSEVVVYKNDTCFKNVTDKTWPFIVDQDNTVYDHCLVCLTSTPVSQI